MALKMPDSVEECVYFTRRSKPQVVAWVLKEKCPKCKKALMGKPKGSDGKVKIRAKEYVCSECGFTMEKQAYEDTLTANIQFTCPKCSFSGEHQMPFKRKKVKLFDEEEGKEVTADALIFNCPKCAQKIAVTKKMK
jgi:predicted RNA-binding Zn-ribbon protein involved in translation (DUF1610 family)